MMDHTIFKLFSLRDWNKIIPENFELTFEEDQLIKKKLIDLHSASNPELINVCGIPGAGKTHYIKKQLLHKPQYADYLFLSFDEIMEQLSGYREVWEKNPAEAFNRYENPARIVGYSLLEQAIQKRCNIIFEHSSTLIQHVYLFESLHGLAQAPYAVKMILIKCSLALALKRAKERTRYVPGDLIMERAGKLDYFIKEYYRNNKAIVDEFITEENCYSPRSESSL